MDTFNLYITIDKIHPTRWSHLDVLALLWSGFTISPDGRADSYLIPSVLYKLYLGCCLAVANIINITMDGSHFISRFDALRIII